MEHLETLGGFIGNCLVRRVKYIIRIKNDIKSYPRNGSENNGRVPHSRDPEWDNFLHSNSSSGLTKLRGERWSEPLATQTKLIKKCHPPQSSAKAKKNRQKEISGIIKLLTCRWTTAIVHTHPAVSRRAKYASSAPFFFVLPTTESSSVVSLGHYLISNTGAPAFTQLLSFTPPSLRWPIPFQFFSNTTSYPAHIRPLRRPKNPPIILWVILLDPVANFQSDFNMITSLALSQRTRWRFIWLAWLILSVELGSSPFLFSTGFLSKPSGLSGAIVFFYVVLLRFTVQTRRHTERESCRCLP